MRNVHDTVLTCVGDTPLVRFQRLTAALSIRVYAKLEMRNPGGSLKDRVALSILDEAERRGDLDPGGTIVEASDGQSSLGLAMAAAIKGYRCTVVVPDHVPVAERAALQAVGAKVVVAPTQVEPDDARSHYRVAQRLAAETSHAYYANQHHNPANPNGHYRVTGPELEAQLDDPIDIFIAGLGTGGAITGIGRYLKEQNPDVQVIGVDPVGSVYFDLFKTGQITTAFRHTVAGIGKDFLPSTLDFSVVDDVVRVSDAEAFHVARRLAREEGWLVGGASGAAVAGALRWLRTHDRPEATAVVLLPDSGHPFLDTIHNDAWLADRGLSTAPRDLGTVADLIGSHPRQPITIPDTTVAIDAIGLLKAHGISQVPVLRQGRVVGVLHERTLLEAALDPATPPARAGELATQDFCVVDRDTAIGVLSDLFRNVRLALVMDGDELQTVLSRIDLIDHVARFSGESHAGS
ncbi:MAG: pyridoxal-phosphate dependent enzyme [Myxococcota bacterium]